jgi:hypothetical protein
MMMLFPVPAAKQKQKLKLKLKTAGLPTSGYRIKRWNPSSKAFLG